MNYFFKILGVSLISVVLGMFLLAAIVGSGVAGMPLVFFGIIFGTPSLIINAFILTFLNKGSNE